MARLAAKRAACSRLALLWLIGAGVLSACHSPAAAENVPVTTPAIPPAFASATLTATWSPTTTQTSTLSATQTPPATATPRRTLTAGPTPEPASLPAPNTDLAASRATRTPPPTYWDCIQGRAACPDETDDWLARLQVPPGFAVSHIVQLPSQVAPTAITFDPAGRLYIATIPRTFDEAFTGEIYFLNDSGELISFAGGFLVPTGLAFDTAGRLLYVSSRAGRFEGKISVIDPEGTVSDLVTGLPCCYSALEHQPNGLAFGPDGLLYVAIGARSDIGQVEIDPLEAGILRLRPDGQGLERFAEGLRNPYDLDFDLQGRLWAGDNGPDYGGPDRLHRIEAGKHYGFPFYGSDCPSCPPTPAGLEIVPPYVTFPPHATPAGLAVYKGSQFPPEYLNSVFVALWNPGPGGRVVRVHGDRQVDDFVSGLWAPVDVVQAPDGSVVVADYLTGRLFRIRWRGLGELSPTQILSN